MATIDKKYIPTYNKFIQQNKQLKDKITPEEWNTLFNVLSKQADDTAEYTKKLHDFITGGGDVSEMVSLHQDAESLIDYINNFLSTGPKVKEKYEGDSLDDLEIGEMFVKILN